MGAIGNVHFVDLNKGEQTFSLAYAPQIKRCEETLRRIDIIENECSKLKVKVNKVGSLENFNRAVTRLREDRRKAENVLLDDIEFDVLQKEKFLTEQIANLKEMSENYNSLIESKRVITVVSQIMNQAVEKDQVARRSELEENKQEI